jgi:GNAT superfamily N-acetyltransferase
MLEAGSSGRNRQAAKVGVGTWRATVTSLTPSELYHFHWHLLRLERGCPHPPLGRPISGTLRPKYLSRVDWANTHIFGCFIGKDMRGAAELRLMRPECRREAEVALSVETAWQGRGMATALMASAITTAQERGIEQLYLSCHVLNRPMQRVAEKFAARFHFDGCECLAQINLPAG